MKKRNGISINSPEPRSISEKERIILSSGDFFSLRVFESGDLGHIHVSDFHF